MKKVLINLWTIFILATIIMSFKNVVLAAEDYDFSGELTGISDWDKDVDTTVKDKTRSIAANIISIIQIVGTGVAVVMLIYIAIRFMLAAPEGKAELKKTAVRLHSRSSYIICSC